MMEGRRLAKIVISGVLLEQWFTTGNEMRYRINQGLPKDAKFIGPMMSKQPNCLDILFEHDSFDIVAEGGQAEVIRIVTEGLE